MNRSSVLQEFVNLPNAVKYLNLHSLRKHYNVDSSQGLKKVLLSTKKVFLRSCKKLLKLTCMMGEGQGEPSAN